MPRKKLAMEGNSNRKEDGGEEGNGHWQPGTALAKQPGVAAKKLAEPAAGTKRKAQDDKNGGDQATGTKGNATRKAKKLRLDGE
jgi:hypothetical protein